MNSDIVLISDSGNATVVRNYYGDGQSLGSERSEIDATTHAVRLDQAVDIAADGETTTTTDYTYNDQTTPNAAPRTTTTVTDGNGNIISRTQTQFEDDGSRTETTTTATGTTRTTYNDDGTVFKTEAVDNGANTLAAAAGATASFLSLVKAIQSGKPLPIATSGVNTLLALQKANTGRVDTVLSGVGASLATVASLYALQKSIEAGDTLGTVSAGAQVLSFGATAYANMLGYQSIGSAAAAKVLSVESAAALQSVQEALPYLNLINDIKNGDQIGIALSIAAIAFPPAAPFLAVARLVFSMFEDPPSPWGSARVVWRADGTLELSVSGGDGGEATVRNTLQSMLNNLQSVVTNFEGQDASAKIAIVANRLPGLSYNNGSYALTDMDPVTGADRTIHYDSTGKPTDARVGSPEYFRSLGEQLVYSALGREAIAPQWEVDTAWLQTQAGDPQAGLTELQRAQRSDLLAPALAKGASSQTWRPIVLDLNGDGVRTLSAASAQVAFDVGSNGFLFNTAWISAQDGFLVLDRNYNSLVDNASELFSNALVADGARGLASMRWVDANADGDISAADPVFAQLRVWQDANGNALVDTGEAKSLSELGIGRLHYGRGSYDKGSQTLQMASPDLVADAVGIKTRVVEGGIVVQSSDGQASLIVTKTEDLSNIAPGKDRIRDGTEDLTLDIPVGRLLGNDKVGGAAGAVLTVTGGPCMRPHRARQRHPRESWRRRSIVMVAPNSVGRHKMNFAESIGYVV